MQDLAAPATVKEFEERLVEVAPKLPKRLRQCADYVAANTDRIAVSTVAEMAEAAGVEPARPCGTRGFRDRPPHQWGLRFHVRKLRVLVPLAGFEPATSAF